MEEDRIVVSKDEGFFHLANRAGDRGRLLWVRIGNTRKQILLKRVLGRLAEIEEYFATGQKVVELRG